VSATVKIRMRYLWKRIINIIAYVTCSAWKYESKFNFWKYFFFFKLYMQIVLMTGNAVRRFCCNRYSQFGHNRNDDGYLLSAYVVTKQMAGWPQWQQCVSHTPRRDTSVATVAVESIKIFQEAHTDLRFLLLNTELFIDFGVYDKVDKESKCACVKYDYSKSS
jgi:hypothetical protein